MINYLYNTFDLTKAKLALFPNNEYILQMFSTFLDRVKYNCIPLKEALLKLLFLIYIKQKELFMQQSFQLCYNYMYARDYMYKFSKQIISST